MRSVYLCLLAFSLAFFLVGCDNSSPAAVKNIPKVAVSGEPGVEIQQALKLSVDKSILKGLQDVSGEPIPLSDSLELKIRPVKDEQRLSVNGKFLLTDTLQENYLDNIVGGKVELQLRFDD